MSTEETKEERLKRQKREAFHRYFVRHRERAKESQRKWRKKNREHVVYSQHLLCAKTYIKDYATVEELQEFKELLQNLQKKERKV